MTDKANQKPLVGPSIWSLLKPYRFLIVLLVGLTIAANALNLVVPQIIAHTIDNFANGNFILGNLVVEFGLVAIFIFLFTYAQNVVQVYASERVARDLRNDLSAKISVQPYEYIDRITPSKLLTNLTSDIDAVKTFVSQAIAALVSSIFLIIGASVLLLLLDWRLGLAVLTVIPVIAGTFYYVLGRVRKLFVRSRKRSTGSMPSSTKAYSARRLFAS